jgi:hypothetical protein
MVPSVSGHVFMFCAPRLVFGGTEVVRSCFLVYRGRPDWFRQSRGRQVPIATGLISMFCASRLISGGTEGVGSHFHVLPAQTRFRWCRGRRVPFSYFALPDSFSAVPRASGPVFMFCAPELVFGDIEGVRSRLLVSRSQTSFRRCRVRVVPFSCFARPNSFSTVPRTPDPIFMFSAPGHVFGVAEGVRSYFHVLRSRACFWRGGRRRVPFSCFALPDKFSAVPRASGPIFMFFTLGLVLGVTEGVDSRFHVLHSRTRFSWYQ